MSNDIDGTAYSMTCGMLTFHLLRDLYSIPTTVIRDVAEVYHFLFVRVIQTVTTPRNLFIDDAFAML